MGLNTCSITWHNMKKHEGKSTSSTPKSNQFANHQNQQQLVCWRTSLLALNFLLSSPLLLATDQTTGFIFPLRQNDESFIYNDESFIYNDVLHSELFLVSHLPQQRTAFLHGTNWASLQKPFFPKDSKHLHTHFKQFEKNYLKTIHL